MMKKADSRKTTYSTIATANNLGSPMAPAAGSLSAIGRRWADPSSGERSNPYPVPVQEYRSR